VESTNKHGCKTYLRVVPDEDEVYNLEGDEEREKYFSVLENAIKKLTSDYARVNDEFVICVNCDYDVDVNVMARKTVREFIGREQELIALQNLFKVDIWLEIVPYILHDADEPKPLLSLERDLIEFLYKSCVELDIDYYIF
jgi:hypothetical protein